MKKKFISVLMLMFIMFCLPITSYAVSGKGTETNPFRISTEEELLLLADFPECYFELENDIEFTGTWEPIAEFSGVFDGKGHTISISSYKEKTNMGFFGILSGTVKNLTLNAKEISLIYTRSGYYVGLFAGKCTGLVSYCKAIGNFSIKAIDSPSISMGGICGEISGSIEKTVANFEQLKLNAYRNSTVYSYENVSGGICAKLTGTITECSNTSNVNLISNSMSYLHYGGLVGTAYSSALVSNSYNLESSLIGSGNYTNYAGVIFDNGGQVINCFSASGNHAVGNSRYGVAKNNTTGTMTNSYYDKTIIGTSSTSYGVPKSTLAMKMQATYQDWDFENVWGIDESEENPINDGYPYLKVFYEDIETPVTISSLSAVNGKLIIDTKITDISDNYTLHIALYDNQNRLCDYLAIPNERQLKDVFVVYPDDGNATYAKIFTWYSTDSIQPVSNCETVTISR